MSEAAAISWPEQPPRNAPALALALARAAAARRQRRQHLVLVALIAALILAALVSLATGAMQIPLSATVAILAKQLGLALPWAFTDAQAAVLIPIRMPRVIVAMLVGGVLGIAGAAIQGLFRNPLAEPGLIGISNGAAMMVVSAIVLGPLLPFAVLPIALAPLLIPAAAFAGALGATLLVIRLASQGGRTSMTTMLLAGIAINALSAAVMGLMIAISDDQQLRSITFWMLGSLGSARWQALPALLLCTLPALIFLPLMGGPLNALALGEAEARHLGISVQRVKSLTTALVALAVGACVALTGIIGFVGLVVPHLLRLIIGPDYRRLLPASALLGATLLLIADLVSRVLIAPGELPIGAVTAIVGAPFFLGLLLRDRRKGKFI